MPHRLDFDSLTAFADAADLGLFLVMPDERVGLWNRWLEKASGIPRDRAVGRSLETTLPEISARLAGTIAQALDKGLAAKLSPRLNAHALPLSRVAGDYSSPIDQLISVSPVYTASGGRCCLVQVRDVSASVAREAQLRDQAFALRNASEAIQEQQSHLQAILDGGHDAVITLDGRGAITSANQAAENMLGSGCGSLLGRNVNSVLRKFPSRTHLLESRPADTGGAFMELTAVSARGNALPVEVAANTTFSRGRPMIVVNIRDISERHKAEKRIRRLAYYDALTDLPNRTLLADRLERSVELTRRGPDKLAVMFLDLDRFKLINDTLGHDVGDKLLNAVAKRLLGCIRASDTVARLGGDEFAIVQTGIRNAAQARILAEKIRSAIQRPFSLLGQELNTSTSIGITLFDGTEPGPRDLLKEADLAMYRAKQSGPNHFRFFQAEMHTSMRKRIDLESALRAALADEAFELWYQPQMALASGQLSGIEALLRWPQTDGGFIAPDVFIPVAEESGLILPLGAWVLQRACRDLRAWRSRQFNIPLVAVNISAAQFQDPNFLHLVASTLRDTGIAARQLMLEITESVLMTHADTTERILRELHALGVSLAIDDFGTGYSSLSYLKRFPVCQIKIDRSFVSDITEDADDAAIVNAVIDLGHNMGQRVVAEGVETPEQLAFLREQCCDDIQGYLISRPLPAADFETLITGERQHVDLARAG